MKQHCLKVSPCLRPQARDVDAHVNHLCIRDHPRQAINHIAVAESRNQWLQCVGECLWFRWKYQVRPGRVPDRSSPQNQKNISVDLGHPGEGQFRHVYTAEHGKTSGASSCTADCGWTRSDWTPQSAAASAHPGVRRKAQICCMKVGTGFAKCQTWCRGCSPSVAKNVRQ